MKLYQHLVEQPFIAATGAAALVHSTWALAVLFSGEPPLWDPTSAASWARWAYWLIPALLIAFALDVGQIATSAEIRRGHRTQSKYTTFVVFALATYYLQWIYIAHHMPALELGPGVYAEGLAARVVLLTRNAAIWIIPALLPLSTTMYTLSGGDNEAAPAAPVAPELIQQNGHAQLLNVQPIELESGQDGSDDDVSVLFISSNRFAATCEHCDWKRDYTSEESAKRGLAAHGAHCPGQAVPSMNGHSNGRG